MMDHGVGKNEREIRSFYEKVRFHLDLLETLPHEDDSSETVEDVEDLYGEITKEEFAKILESYERQQENEETRDEPVNCKEVFGHNFARLLYSKSGFHHLGSTSFLVNDLRLNDVNRNSFLNGHASYALNEDEKLDYLLELQKKKAVLIHATKAHEYMDDKQLELAIGEIEEARKLNPKSGDYLSAQARMLVLERRYSDAIRTFEDAQQNNPQDHERLSKHYLQALVTYSDNEYHKKNYQKGLALSSKALSLDPSNKEAELIRGLCNHNIHQRSNFGGRSKFVYRDRARD